MTLSLSDVTKFFHTMETYTQNQDGILNKDELQSAYTKMLADHPDQIPQEIKDKFVNGTVTQDQFDAADKLGIKDNFVNDQELYSWASGDSSFKPWTPSRDTPANPGNKLTDDAGYSVYKDAAHTQFDAQGTAAATIKDLKNVIGGQASQGDGLTSDDIDKITTAIQNNKGTVDNADGKLALLADMKTHFKDRYDNVAGDGDGGTITTDSLAQKLDYDSQHPPTS